jgi:hypothetical protein
VNASYLYIDGDVKIYTSNRLVPEVWNSHRRMPLPGIVQYFVNDLLDITKQGETGFAAASKSAGEHLFLRTYTARPATQYAG